MENMPTREALCMRSSIHAQTNHEMIHCARIIRDLRDRNHRFLTSHVNSFVL